MNKSETATELLTFPQWYRMIYSGELKKIKDKIINDCMLEKNDRGFCPVLYHWLIGKTPVPPLAQPIINKIAGQQLNFDFKPVGK
jgi:hypothetical protein